ncbi:MAG: hypothetical protein LBI39_02645 [Puniceicoccales bacterium]|jgi:hypothetical protein|nr:hypothetical protein [Puniceicoccales bacterium]
MNAIIFDHPSIRVYGSEYIGEILITLQNKIGVNGSKSPKDVLADILLGSVRTGNSFASINVANRYRLNFFYYLIMHGAPMSIGILEYLDASGRVRHFLEELA